MKNSQKFRCFGVLFCFVLSKKPLIGFAVNKKLGNAVARNLFKRRCLALLFSEKNILSLHLVVRPLVPLEKIDCLPLCFEKLYEFVNGS